MLGPSQDLRWIYQPGSRCQIFRSSPLQTAPGCCPGRPPAVSQEHAGGLRRHHWLPSPHTDPERVSGTSCQLLSPCGHKGLLFLSAPATKTHSGPWALLGRIAGPSPPHPRRVAATPSPPQTRTTNELQQLRNNNKYHTPCDSSQCMSETLLG